MRKNALLLVVFLFSTLYVSVQNISITEGALDAYDSGGKRHGAFPLKRTDVKVEISGFLFRVKVQQEFENNYAKRNAGSGETNRKK